MEKGVDKMYGNVPVKVAASVMGKSEMYVRRAIEDGRIDIGCCSGRGKRKSYYISPKKLFELTGYEWKGESQCNE